MAAQSASCSASMTVASQDRGASEWAGTRSASDYDRAGMSFRSCRVSAFVLLVGCAAPEATSEVSASVVASTGPFVVHGAFAAGERERLESAMLPVMSEGLARWREVGLRPLHEPVHLVIAPPIGMDPKVALHQLYGDGVEDDLRGLSADVHSLATLPEITDRLTAFACAKPGLMRAIVQRFDQALTPDATGSMEIDPADPALVSRAAAEVDREISAYLSGARRVTKDDNAEFVRIRQERCSYLAFGRRSDATRYEPFDEADVVLHELAHAQHFGEWIGHSEEPVPPEFSSTVNEAMADVMAQVMTSDPCFGKVLGPSGEVVGCRRRLDEHVATVSDEVLEKGRGDHDSGDGLRHFFWDLHAELSPRDLDRAIAASVQGVGQFLRTRRLPFGEGRVRDDLFAEAVRGYTREYGAAAAAFGGACGSTSSRACERIIDYLGSEAKDTIAAWTRFAPTTIGAVGTAASSPGGDVEVSFEVDVPRGKIAAMQVRRGSLSERYRRGNQLFFQRVVRGGQPWTVLGQEFVSAAGESVFWTSDGVIASGAPSS
jgi:hypothetical protein